MAAQRPNLSTEDGDADYKYWIGQIDDYKAAFKKWEDRSKKIVKRYRTESATDSDTKPARYNLLYANTALLQPAIYNQTPQPMVDRKTDDTDAVARLASEMLQRALAATIEEDNFDEPIEQSRDDYLFTSRGQVWARYEAKFGDPLVAPPAGEADEDTPDKEQQGEPDLELLNESAMLDYVPYTSFAHSVAKTWKQVWWVGREIPLAKDQCVKMFGENIANLMSFQDSLAQDKDRKTDDKTGGAKVCNVWEIWDKKKRQVRFIARSYTKGLLLEKAYPFNPSGGFPCPKPVYGITTNDTLIPVPFYLQYQDQALQIDEMTARMSLLARAVKVAGIVDASVGVTAMKLFESDDMEMTQVKDLAAKYLAGGSNGLSAFMQFTPIEQFAEALKILHAERDAVIQDAYTISGMSDIMRGEVDPNESATATSMKGTYGSLRLRKMQRNFQTFVRDTLRIMAEIICENFSLETLVEMTNINEMGPQAPKAPRLIPAPPPPPPQPGMPPQTPQLVPNPVWQQYDQQLQNWQQMVQQAFQLLQNDKERTFRVSIETDSTIGMIEQQNKQDVLQFTSTISTLLQQAIPALNANPALAPFIKHTLMMAIRQFKVGRQTEQDFEDSLDAFVAQAQQPKPPAPTPALQVAQIKEQGENQRAQLDAKVELGKSQADLQRAQIEAQGNQAEIQKTSLDSNAQVKVAAINAQAQVAAALAKHPVVQPVA